MNIGDIKCICDSLKLLKACFWGGEKLLVLLIVMFWCLVLYCFGAISRQRCLGGDHFGA
jgi:hypothetical protein